VDIVTLVSAEFSQHTYFIRKINIEPTMSANVMDEDFSRIDGSTFTTNYKYNSEEQEFIFCCKGKPFATLVTSNIPTPTFNLLDFDLIRDLGLKMTDLQCRKFHYAGNKFRILGKVSTTVQCIDKGSLSGVNFHIKGLVVSDLNRVLDSHCVAGTKLKEFLLKSITKAGSEVAPDAAHVSPVVPDAAHVSPVVPDATHLSPVVPDADHVSPVVPDAAHVSPVVPDARQVLHRVPDARQVLHKVPDGSHVPSMVQKPEKLSPSTGAKQKHSNCVQCRLPLVNTIDKDQVRCTICHEKLLMMLAKMPHKWFQPAFRDEMAAVRGIQCKAEYSDLEYSDSDSSSFCSQESPFRRDWGKEPWKRDWEERLRRKRRK